MPEELDFDAKGVMLALGAVSEALDKQNAFLDKMLTKQMNDEKCAAEAKMKADEDKKAELAKSERATLVKEVAAELAKSLKISKQDSKESAKTITTDSKKVQDVIQAAEDDKEVLGDKDTDAEKENKEKADEKEEDNDKEYPEIIEKLKKEIETLKKGNDELIKSEVEARLRKAGWREETGFKGVKRVELGAPEAFNIKKSDDKVGELAKLSYAQLKRMENQAEVDELPAELKQFIS